MTASTILSFAALAFACVACLFLGCALLYIAIFFRRLNKQLRRDRLSEYRLPPEAMPQSRPHSVLGVAIRPFVGLKPTRVRKCTDYRIPQAAPINRAHAIWRSKLSTNSAAYYQPELVSSRRAAA